MHKIPLMLIETDVCGDETVTGGTASSRAAVGHTELEDHVPGDQ